MDAISKIKTEVERRRTEAELKKNEAYGVSAITYNMHLAEENLCMFLLSFIESLEKPRVIDEGKDEIDEGFTRMMLKGSTTKIKGWVARESDGYIYVFAEKPKRNQKIGGWSGKTLLEFPKATLPEILWSSEPIEVELTISRVIK